MLLENYYSEKNGRVFISREQGSAFAKNIADDFNPIHDIDSQHFCVPGDLLFALVLAKYGISNKITFTFVGMVSNDVSLIFPANPGEEFSIIDENDREYLRVKRDNSNVNSDKKSIIQLIKNYVAFSGENFPDLLVPLMAEHNIMVNQKRPLVIYQSMSIELESLDIPNPTLELSETSLTVQGKKALAELNFLLKTNGNTVGRGVKNLGLRGLLEYEQEAVNSMVKEYNRRKQQLA